MRRLGVRVPYGAPIYPWNSNDSKGFSFAFFRLGIYDFPLFSAVQLMIHILSCAGLDDLQADSSIFCWRSFMHTMYYTSETYILLDKIKNALKNVLLEHFIFTGTELYDGAVFSLFSLIFSMVFHLKRVWQI